MKKMISLLCTPLLFTFLISCSSNSNSTPLEKSPFENTKSTNEEVTLTIKEKDITPSTENITLILTNNSNNQYTYGLEQFLEVQVDNEWYSISPLEGMGWIEIAYILSPNSTSESSFQLKKFYGELEKGHYRIVKRLFANDGNKLPISVEFDIK